jgi:hypothetical protein
MAEDRDLPLDAHAAGWPDLVPGVKRRLQSSVRERNMPLRSGSSGRKPEGGETLMNFLKWVCFRLKLRIELEASLNCDQK